MLETSGDGVVIMDGFLCTNNPGPFWVEEHPIKKKTRCTFRVHVNCPREQAILARLRVAGPGNGKIEAKLSYQTVLTFEFPRRAPGS